MYRIRPLTPPEFAALRAALVQGALAPCSLMLQGLMSSDDNSQREAASDFLHDLTAAGLAILEAKKFVPLTSDNGEFWRYHRAAIKMQEGGGGFAEAIGKAFTKADSNNVRRLIEAFPELFDNYMEK